MKTMQQRTTLALIMKTKILADVHFLQTLKMSIKMFKFYADSVSDNFHLEMTSHTLRYISVNFWIT